MKGSLATSAVIHAAVLTLALVSLGSPESFDVANVECDFFLSSRQRAALSKSEAGLLYLELVCASEREMFDLQ